MQAGDLVGLCRRIALPLGGDDVKDDRTLPAGSTAESLLEPTDVVSVDGSRVADSERLEEHARFDDLPDGRTQPVEGGERERRDAARKVLHQVAHAITDLQIAGVQP